MDEENKQLKEENRQLNELLHLGTKKYIEEREEKEKRIALPTVWASCLIVAAYSSYTNYIYTKAINSSLFNEIISFIFYILAHSIALYFVFAVVHVIASIFEEKTEKQKKQLYYIFVVALLSLVTYFKLG